MEILSLFDGISGAKQALNNLGIICKAYYASEVDKYAIQISKKNHPDIIQVGDVRKLSAAKYKNIDLLIGGSPCQNLSCAGNREGLSGEKSSLFFEYLRFLKEIKPKYFVLENVYSMGKKNAAKITALLGVEPILINSALLTAQSRKRYYWTNIPGIEPPEDRHIYLKDILLSGETEDLKSYCIGANYQKLNVQNYIDKKQGQMVYGAALRSVYTSTGNRHTKIPGDKLIKQLETRQDEKSNALTSVKSDSLVYDTTQRIGNIGYGGQGNRVYSANGKSIALNCSSGGTAGKTGAYETSIGLRKLHPIECERLQGFPDNYTEGCSNTQRYKMLGNSFTVPVIEHILKNIFGGK